MGGKRLPFFKSAQAFLQMPTPYQASYVLKFLNYVTQPFSYITFESTWIQSHRDIRIQT